MEKPKWRRKLNKSETEHLAATSCTGKPNLASFKRNLIEQNAEGITCSECDAIARKLGIEI